MKTELRITRWQHQAILDGDLAGQSGPQIAKAAGVSAATVYRILEEAGRPVRKRRFPRFDSSPRPREISRETQELISLAAQRIPRGAPGRLAKIAALADVDEQTVHVMLFGRYFGPVAIIPHQVVFGFDLEPDEATTASEIVGS